MVTEPEPELAAQFWEPVALEKIRLYARALSENGQTLGLLGPLEFERLWTRHLINCALVSPLVWPGARVADVGSGAGLPGIVLAATRPDAHFVLIEPMTRRADWLQSQVTALGLDNTEVLRARAEDAPHGACDQVTARAVSALRTLLPLVTPLVRVGGELILMKGAGAAQEIAAADKQVSRLRLGQLEIIELGGEWGTEITRVVRAMRG